MTMTMTIGDGTMMDVHDGVCGYNSLLLLLILLMLCDGGDGRM